MGHSKALTLVQAKLGRGAGQGTITRSQHGCWNVADGSSVIGLRHGLSGFGLQALRVG